MTEIIFSFDTEDFTSRVAADAICTEAEILREEGVKGGFCLVGLLASQLENWGREDVLDALKFHEIGTHSYGHSLHPTINEYTDIENFDDAYTKLERQEREALQMIKKATDNQKIFVACPPGNQKSYVAMYAYADMGIPLYADTFCDTKDGDGVFWCNIYHLNYTYNMEQLFFKEVSDAEFSELLNFLAEKKRAVLYTHPNYAEFNEFWDMVNYNKVNHCEFGQWKECQRRPKEETEHFYANIRKIIKLLKNDGRFKISSYSELAKKVNDEGERKIVKSDIRTIKEQLEFKFLPLTNPVSLSISDVFLACRDFLCGREEHICGKVYGFLDTPFAIENDIVLSAEDIVKSATTINADRFFPCSVTVGGVKIGPGDWLRAAMEVICGKETVALKPSPQLPSLDMFPTLDDKHFLGWIQSDDFKDEYLSKRLKLQSWTMRFMKQ